MSKYHKQLTVGYSADQMFDLISDIRAYPEFIPLCVSTKIHDLKGNIMKSSIKIAKGILGFEITTLSILEPGRSISIELENGPFNSFHGGWLFNSIGNDQCTIQAHFEFEFSNRLLSGPLERLLSQIASSKLCTLVQGFSFNKL